ncbi:MAG: ATP-dependent sacrificial sulfur transferase LarE [Acidobacteriota bacterium]
MINKYRENLSPEEKEQWLKRLLRGYGSAVAAFSGGGDSSYLLYVAWLVLKDKVLAVTSQSPVYPQHHLKRAKDFAHRYGIAHTIIATNELASPRFRLNPPSRCYYCKVELFTRLKEIAAEKGYNVVIDGSNLDDTSDFRPGLKASRELKVLSPLIDVGITKDDVRYLSRKAGLPTWNLPSSACLASRFPYHTAITSEKLKAVGQGEDFLRELGFQQVRLRHHGDLARIEVLSSEIPRFLDSNVVGKVIKKLKSLGYKYIALDLQGYRTGSMNEVLKTSAKEVP